MADYYAQLEAILARLRDVVLDRTAGEPDSRAVREEVLRRYMKFCCSQLSSPLRTWALVIRAGDSRMKALVDDDVAVQGEARRELERELGMADGESADFLSTYLHRAGKLILTRDVVRLLCEPIHVPYPGVSITEAAERFGVSEVTIWRWTKPETKAQVEGDDETGETGVECDPACGLKSARLGGYVRAKGKIADDEIGPFGPDRRVRCVGRLLVKDVYRNFADRKRDVVRVWTREPIWPGGNVMSQDWGEVLNTMWRVLPPDWFQVVERYGEVRSDGKYQWYLRCPPGRGCGERVLQLYAATPMWTMLEGGVMAARFADDAQSNEHILPEVLEMNHAQLGGFLCRKCAKLVYESSERHWKRGKAGEDVYFDRFVQRLTGGLVRGYEVVNMGGKTRKKR